MDEYKNFEEAIKDPGIRKFIAELVEKPDVQFVEMGRDSLMIIKKGTGIVESGAFRWLDK